MRNLIWQKIILQPWDSNERRLLAAALGLDVTLVLHLDVARADALREPAQRDVR